MHNTIDGLKVENKNLTTANEELSKNYDKLLEVNKHLLRLLVTENNYI
jgi:hypothetical protein